MPRILYGLLFIPLYFIWVIYRAFIKGDIRQHKNDFYGLTFFAAVIAVVYYCMLYW